MSKKQLRSTYSPISSSPVLLLPCVWTGGWLYYLEMYQSYQKFPSRNSDIEHVCQCRTHKRLRFNPWIRKIPWRRAWQLTLVFLPGEFYGQRSLVATVCTVTKNPTPVKQLSMPTPIRLATKFVLWKSWIMIQMFFSASGNVYLLFKKNENGSNFWPFITYYHWFTHSPCHHEVLRL